MTLPQFLPYRARGNANGSFAFPMQSGGRGLPVSIHALKLPARIGCLHSGAGAPAPREIGNVAR